MAVSAGQEYDICVGIFRNDKARSLLTKILFNFCKVKIVR